MPQKAQESRRRIVDLEIRIERLAVDRLSLETDFQKRHAELDCEIISLEKQAEEEKRKLVEILANLNPAARSCAD